MLFIFYSSYHVFIHYTHHVRRTGWLSAPFFVYLFNTGLLLLCDTHCKKTIIITYVALGGFPRRVFVSYINTNKKQG